MRGHQMLLKGWHGDAAIGLERQQCGRDTLNLPPNLSALTKRLNVYRH
jgi:hypothetical protein